MLAAEVQEKEKEGAKDDEGTKEFDRSSVGGISQGSADKN